MAEWSDLPQDILYVISLLLTASSSIDVLRFRSVCSTWRRAAFQPRSLFPSSGADLVVPLPGSIVPVLGESLHLTKRTIYHLQNTGDNNPSPWIIKFDSKCLFDPLTSSPRPLYRLSFRPFSFLNLRVRELGVDYIVRFREYDLQLIRKVAVLNQLETTFVMLLVTVSYIPKGKVMLESTRVMYVISKSGDEEWRLLTTNEVYYQDVIVMGGEFYVVAGLGRQLARLNPIDWSEEIIVASPPSPPTENWVRKFLVECQGNLLLVELYCYRQFNEWFPDEQEYRIETVQVFKLDENSREWMEVNDLGEMILFIGDTCSFSASAKDVFGETSTATGCKGNCIICCCREDMYDDEVFDLETRSVEDLDDLPQYSRVFWPPPKWAYSASKRAYSAPDKLT